VSAAALAVIHSTPVTIDIFRRLAEELLAGAEVVNFVDESILPQLARNGGDLRPVERRLVQYARFAEEAGAHVILSACSSVGEATAAMQRAVRVPVVRVGAAMAEEAVRRGSRVGVAATLSTTLEPTVRLLEKTARASDRALELEPLLVQEAFERLSRGDREGHDRLLAASLERLAARNDVVVLAQASMARVVERLAEAHRARCLSSPRLAMERVRIELTHREPGGGA
jgi:aspartate/glutamate racemase